MTAQAAARWLAVAALVALAAAQTPCKPGTFPSGPKKVCKPCKKGSVSQGEGTPCTACPAFRAPNVEKSACVCAPGVFDDEICDKCAPGFGGSPPAAPKLCKACSSKAFSPGGLTSLKAACKACPKGTTPTADKSSCICPSPTVFNGTGCAPPCPIGATISGSGVCVCPLENPNNLNGTCVPPCLAGQAFMPMLGCVCPPPSVPLLNGTCADACGAGAVRNTTTGDCDPVPIVCSGGQVNVGGVCKCVLNGVPFANCITNTMVSDYSGGTATVAHYYNVATSPLGAIVTAAITAVLPAGSTNWVAWHYNPGSNGMTSSSAVAAFMYGGGSTIPSTAQYKVTSYGGPSAWAASTFFTAAAAEQLPGGPLLMTFSFTWPMGKTQINIRNGVGEWTPMGGASQHAYTPPLLCLKSTGVISMGACA